MKSRKKRQKKERVTKFAIVLIQSGKTIIDVHNGTKPQVSRPILTQMKKGRQIESIKDSTWSRVAKFLKLPVAKIKGFV